MGARHKKQIAVDRPDGVDATLIRGIAAWNQDHQSPDWLAYMVSLPSGVTSQMPARNTPYMEMTPLRSKYDFSFVNQVRFTFGVDYGSARLTIKYSYDGVTWKFFDGVSGPYVTQAQGNANRTVYVTAWTTIVADAKGDRWIAPFAGLNTEGGIQHTNSIYMHVR